MSTIELTYEQMEEVIRQGLKESISYTNTDEGGWDITDYEMRDHLLYVLNYYSTPQDFKAFCEDNGFDYEKYKGC